VGAVRGGEIGGRLGKDERGLRLRDIWQGCGKSWGSGIGKGERSKRLRNRGG